MKRALNSLTGRLVTLSDLWRERASDVLPLLTQPHASFLIRAALNKGLVCPECYNPVHVYAVGRVGGFALAGRKLTEPDCLTSLGFQHYTPTNKRNNGIKSVADCSLYCPYDPRFNDQVKESKDPAVGAHIKEVLRHPEILAFNRALLSALHRAATGRPIDRASVDLYNQTAKNYFMGNEVFASHPYVLPYAVMSTVPFFVRQGARGPYRVKFAETGAQELLFRNEQGCDCLTKIPASLHLVIQCGTAWRPMKYDTRSFAITEDAARQLAGRDTRASITTLLAIPKDLLPAPLSAQKNELPKRSGGQAGYLPGLEAWIGLQRRWQQG